MLMCEHVTHIVYAYVYMHVCICMCARAPAFTCAHAVCVHGCLRIAVRLCTVLSKADLALQLPTSFPGS